MPQTISIGGSKSSSHGSSSYPSSSRNGGGSTAGRANSSAAITSKATPDAAAQVANPIPQAPQFDEASQAAAAQASQVARGGKGAPYYMHGLLKYPGMSEALFEQQRIEFAGLKSPDMIQAELLEAQRVKATNEAHAARQAKLQQEREAANEARDQQIAKESAESSLGIVTSRLQQADASDKLWHAREHARVWAENIKMYEALANQQAKQKEEEVVKAEARMKIRSQEDKEFLAEKNARIDLAKEKLYKIELNPPKHNTLEVEKYSPLIIKTLMQYSRDYEGFHRQIISDAMPIQALHTLSLKKTGSVDSRVVDLVFDFLRDNHLPSLKTLDLSDNPKSIGAGQIGKLADSFFSGNNNLETLDLSCVYPPPADIRAPFKPGEERLVGDAYAGDYPLGHKLFELYCSVSTCNQPLSITLESAVSYPLNSCDYRFDALHIPYIFISHYMDWMGEPASFKTTSIDMVNYTRQILEKMSAIQNEKNLRVGGYEALIKYHGEEVPHVIETFTWGITKCLTPKVLNKTDFEWVKGSLIESPHDYHHLARIMQLTQTKLDAFVCVTEVMDDRIITHDMLNHKAEWQDAFPLGHFNKRYPKGGKENITKQLDLAGKANTQPFDSSCKHCEESQFAYFLNTQSFLQKADITTMVELNLSRSNLGDGDARIMAKLLKQGSLPNLTSLDVSGNQFSGVGNTYFAQAAKNVQQPIKILVDTIVNGLQKQLALGFGSKEAKQNVIKDWLKVGQDNGIDVKNVTVSKDISSKIDNTFNLTGNFLFGWAKCSIVPNSVKAFAADQIIAIASKNAGIVNTAIGVVTCYFETFDESASSQQGIQFMTDIGLVGQSEFLENIE